MNNKTAYICTICDTTHLRMPSGGYCDETLDCACDGGESLVAV